MMRAISKWDYIKDALDILNVWQHRLHRVNAAGRSGIEYALGCATFAMTQRGDDGRLNIIPAALKPEAYDGYDNFCVEMLEGKVEVASWELQHVRGMGIDQGTQPVKFAGTKGGEKTKDEAYPLKDAIRFATIVVGFWSLHTMPNETFQLCLPIMTAEGLPRLGLGPKNDGVGEPMIRAFMRVVRLIYNQVKPPNEPSLTHEIRLHKAEVKSSQGFEWWSAACKSDREASVLTDQVKSKSHRKAYAYLGGGSISAEGSDHLQGVVIKIRGNNVLASVVAAMVVLKEVLRPQKDTVAAKSNAPNREDRGLTEDMIYVTSDVVETLFDDEAEEGPPTEDAEASDSADSRKQLVEMCNEVVKTAKQKLAGLLSVSVSDLLGNERGALERLLQ